VSEDITKSQAADHAAEALRQSYWDGGLFESVSTNGPVIHVETRNGQFFHFVVFTND
jgi:hypothetical protein